jgi:hypothetical protein
MVKYIVTVYSIIIDGIKYNRGDIVELNTPNLYGRKLDLYVAPEKPKRRRKKVDIDE